MGEGTWAYVSAFLLWEASPLLSGPPQAWVIRGVWVWGVPLRGPSTCGFPANFPEIGWRSLQRECDGSGFPFGPVPSVGGRPQVKGSALLEGSWLPVAHRAGQEVRGPGTPSLTPGVQHGPAKAEGFREGCGWAELALWPGSSVSSTPTLG